MMKGKEIGVDDTLAPKSEENPRRPEAENAGEKTPTHSASDPVSVTTLNATVAVVPTPIEKVSGSQGTNKDPIEAAGSPEGLGKPVKPDEELELTNKLAGVDLGKENELLPGSKSDVNVIPKVPEEEPSLQDMIEGAVGPVNVPFNEELTRTLDDPKFAKELKELVASSFVDKPFDPKDWEGMEEEFKDLFHRLE